MLGEGRAWAGAAAAFSFCLVLRNECHGVGAEALLAASTRPIRPCPFASRPLPLPQVSDTVHMLETMHETHVAHLLPRVAACQTAVEAFAERCMDCKVGGE